MSTKERLADDELDDYGFVLASKYRVGVVIVLEGRPNGISPVKISRFRSRPADKIRTAIKELRERGLVECLTPDRHKGRLYALTDRGQAIAPHVTEAIQDA